MASQASSPRTPRKHAKRKRAASDGIHSQDAINPFSRSPSTLAQFALAGVADTDEDPTVTIRNFPHRGLPRDAIDLNAKVPSDDEDYFSDAGSGAKGPGSRRRGKLQGDAVDDYQKGHVGVLLQSIHAFIDQGHIAKAAKAYGLLLQLRPRSKPIDIRQHNLWALGAEIIMREGEEQRQIQQQLASSTTDEASGSARIHRPARWGATANMNKLKAYLETLIHRHPYNYKFPRNVSALDFRVAMLNCEIYNIHAEHTASLSLLDQGAFDRDDDDLELPEETTFGSDPMSHHEGTPGWEARVNMRKDEFRRQALTAMRDILKRMDKLMEELPYSKNTDFLRLRATASLYIADLFIPIAEKSPSKLAEARKDRKKERQTARNALQKLVDAGCELDTVTQGILFHKDVQHEPFRPPFYSSLPIRKG